MSSQPEWISDLLERVCGAINLFDEGAPIGCHYNFYDDMHEVSLFIAPTEIVGGPCDGQNLHARFLVDVLEVMQAFEVIDNVTWQPLTVDGEDEVGPHLAITGEYRQQLVWLRVLACTPQQFLPGRILRYEEQEPINLWGDDESFV